MAEAQERANNLSVPSASFAEGGLSRQRASKYPLPRAQTASALSGVEHNIFRAARAAVLTTKKRLAK
jgi:hypothetical protein